MSIVPLVKVTVCGHLVDKAAALTDLQEMGCLHLIPLTPEGTTARERDPSPEAREALNFLRSCPQRRHQVRDASKFDAAAVEQQALELQRQIQTREDERDFLRGRIKNLRPWGEFRFSPLDERKQLRLWFCVVPHYQMKDVEATGLIWQVVGRDNRFEYVIVISEEEPRGMPVARTHTGSKPLSELEQRLEEVEVELEDLQAERAALTRWCDLLANNLDRLEDQHALVDAFLHTYEQGPIFALQGWAPQDQVPALEEYSQGSQVALQLQEPSPEDNPPVLLHNRPMVAVGEDLVSFYRTPQYRLWDPSVVVLFSFAIFFAMIISDVGYALLIGLGVFMGWQALGQSPTGQRLRVMFSFLVAGSVVWGAMVGSYFGVTPPAGSLLGTLHVLDLQDFSLMMQLSIFIGISHLVLANAVTAWRHRSSAAALAPAGWIAVFLGAIALWYGYKGVGPAYGLKTAGYGTMVLGMACIFWFSGAGAPLVGRLTKGFSSLTRITTALGDTLSYLRLFALGLASASLAATFNDLAGQVNDSVAGGGMLLALLILIVGHTMNFGLCLMSGFVHGLRLNYIEFFNWSIPEEGRPFRAFEKKEIQKWTK